jgi:hypothetical protein
MEELTTCCLQETCLVDRNKHWFRMIGWKKTYQAIVLPKMSRNSNSYIRQSELQTYISQKRQGHFIILKGAMYQEEIIIINLHAPNVSVLNCIEYTLKNLDI